MTLILKTVATVGSPVESDNEHGIHADIASCHFRRYSDGSGAEALLYCREPVKTAMVPGFHEIEKRVSFTGTAYLMNENGRTVSTFTARTSGDTGPVA